MSPDSDRIAVPTNGHKPHALTTPLAPLRGEPPTAEPVTTVRPTDPALLGAVSPRQLAIGFGIIASLVLLALGRSRTRRDR